MKHIITGLSLLAFATFAVSAGDAEKGKALSETCVACHGADGNSLAANFPKIAGQNEAYVIKQLNDMRVPQSEGGREVVEMTAIIADFSEQDIADLAAYFADQIPQGGAADPELVEVGEKLYRGGDSEKMIAACTGCHGPDGKGNKGAAYPMIAGQHADYIEKQLKAFRLGADQPQAQGARINDGDTKMMRSVAANMSDLQIKAVASFISGLR